MTDLLSGHVKISSEVETAVEGTIWDILERAGVGARFDINELAERIAASTLNTYNSVRGREPVPEMVTGDTGKELERALRDRLELLVNRLTYMNDAVDRTYRESQVDEFVYQILGRLKSRDYDIDPKQCLVLYGRDGQVVERLDLTTFNLSMIVPSEFKERIEQLLERFQGRNAY